MSDKGKALAPSDRECDQAWKTIMGIATDHCLIVQAYGGTATLALPEEQRKAAIREKVLMAHNRREKSIIIWAGTAAEARQYAFSQGISKETYIYAHSEGCLLGRHGMTIIKTGTYYEHNDTVRMKGMIDEETGTVR